MPGDIPAAIQRALVEIDRSGVSKVVGAELKNERWWVETVFDVALPQRWQKNGKTPLGVRRQEPVYFSFATDFPARAPFIYLRPDFPADFPHLYSYVSDGFRLPCVYAGNLSDLMHSVGTFHPVLVQAKDWLDRAARNGLYDNTVGWEPVILPNDHGTLIIEASALVNAVNDQQGFQLIAVDFMPGAATTFTRVDRVNAIPNYASLTNASARAETALLQVWPLPRHTREVRNFSDVINLEALFERIDARGSGTRFPIMKHLREIASAINTAANGTLVTVPVVFVATLRRPVPITDQTHCIEPIPFLLDLPVRRPQQLDAVNVPVKMLNHRYPAAAELMARLSGVPFMPDQDPIVFIGAGSLGSKLSAHTIKAGVGPLRIIDHGDFVPHTMARHEAGFPMAEKKARVMALTALAHGVDAVSHAEDVTSILRGLPGKRWADLGIERARFVIDSTASDHVQHALIATEHALPGRLISASFFANGSAAGLFLEGANRSPRIDDLQASLYDLAIDDPLHPFLHGANSGLTRQYVGIGCHSMTMIMHNADAALLAAGIGKKLLQYYANAPAASGEWWFGRHDDSGLGTRWQSQTLSTTEVLARADRDQNNWEVRILSPVMDKMRAEASRWGRLEAGGTLYGIVNALARCITVTRAEEPPDDSVREESRFIHGTRGLRQRVRYIEQRSKGLISMLGTWHSHPMGGGPSRMDRDTAAQFAELRIAGPFLMLIQSPQGPVRALIEERDQ